jgi:predicted enzyme related to lactoylglutathione lyase
VKPSGADIIHLVNGMSKFLTINRKEVIVKHTLRGLTTVSYFAADHAAAKQWYTDFLGIEPYFERPGYVEFRLGDYQHELGIIDSKYVPGTQSINGRAGIVVYWHVDDVDAVLQKAISMGAKQLEAPQDRGQGFITATVVDPFGNILGIMYNPHYLHILTAGQKE